MGRGPVVTPGGMETGPTSAAIVAHFRTLMKNFRHLPPNPSFTGKIPVFRASTGVWTVSREPGHRLEQTQLVHLGGPRIALPAPRLGRRRRRRLFRCGREL